MLQSVYQASVLVVDPSADSGSCVFVLGGVHTVPVLRLRLHPPGLRQLGVLAATIFYLHFILLLINKLSFQK